MKKRVESYFCLVAILIQSFFVFACQKQNDNIIDSEIRDEIFEEVAKDQIIIEIEDFLNKIYQEEVKQVYFTAYNNVNQSYTFLHFIDNEELVINENLVDKKYSKTRPGTIKKRIDWIVIHDTGNNAIGANGQAHSNYITKNNPGLSWHYTVDEFAVYQHIPDNEVAWHAGDGTRETGTKWYSTTYNKTNYGGGNMNGIGIETCVHNGIDYLKTLITTAKLAATLLYKYDLEIEALKMHYDFSGKNCPYVLRKDNYFPMFKNLVSYYLEAITILSQVKIDYIPQSQYVDDSGIISNDIADGMKIAYQVVVTHNNKTYNYNYQTTISKK